jgi:hypothetical protein
MQNKIFSQFIALIRRCISTPEQEGELIMVTQFLHKVDVNLRECATQIRYHILHYTAYCQRCKMKARESSELPKDLKMEFCRRCGARTFKKDFLVEVMHFRNEGDYQAWMYSGSKTHYYHYFTKRVEGTFSKYSTMQWDDLLT